MKTDCRVMKAGDYDVLQRGGILGCGIDQVFCRGYWAALARVPVLYGTGLRNRIQSVGLEPAGPGPSYVFGLFAVLFDVALIAITIG